MVKKSGLEVLQILQ